MDDEFREERGEVSAAYAGNDFGVWELGLGWRGDERKVSREPNGNMVRGGLVEKKRGFVGIYKGVVLLHPSLRALSPSRHGVMITWWENTLAVEKNIEEYEYEERRAFCFMNARLSRPRGGGNG